MQQFLRRHVLSLLLLGLLSCAGSPLSKAASPAEFSREAQSYTEQNGVPAFLEEYYNLLGTSQLVVLNSKNRGLAEALGIRVPSDASVPRARLHSSVDEKFETQCRANLLELFQRQAGKLNLGQAQLAFLRWHFSAPKNYGSVASIDDSTAVLGWNVGQVFPKKIRRFYTFGLLGCTLSLAVSPDGAAYLSHYDVSIVQEIAGFKQFLREHPGSSVVFIGVAAKLVASEVLKTDKPRQVIVHQKPEGLDVSYAVDIERNGERLVLKYAANRVSEDYIPSIHNGDYGRWFRDGRFGQIYPPADQEFQDLPVETLILRPRPSQSSEE